MYAQGAISRPFKRGFSAAKEAKLIALASSPSDNWFKDLLSLWTPSGIGSGSDGLRLAVRDGYLNFYRLGQSVARVAFARDGVPFAATHGKYTHGPACDRQVYAVTRDGTTVCDGLPSISYFGISTVKGWIAAIEGTEGGGSRWVGEEKFGVDQVVGQNPQVIDLEMGLPAEVGSRNAYRMDIVALEPAKANARVVFWEAKLLGDKRLRSRTEPEIVAQLERYRNFVAGGGRSAQIGDAYREACRFMVALHEAAGLGADRPLDPQVRKAAAAGEPLEVDPAPRLAVFDGAGPPATRAHLAGVEALRQRGVHVALRPPRDLDLDHPENRSS